LYWQYSPYILPYLLGGVVSLAVAAIAFRRRHTIGAMAFVGLHISLSIWSLANVFDLGCADLQVKAFWTCILYIGIVFMPVFWFVFARRYVTLGTRPTRRTILLLCIMPAVTLILMWTNRYHGLMRDIHGLKYVADLVIIDKTYGLWFWVHTAYTYALVLYGCYVIIRATPGAARPYRRQSMLLFSAVALPVAGNLVFVLTQGRLVPIDLTPPAFSVSGALIGYALLRYGLLDVMPVARDVILETMSDGVLVVDRNRRIVAMNPAAEEVFGVHAKDVIGKALRQALRVPEWLAARYGDAEEPVSGIEVKGERTDRVYDLSIAPIRRSNDDLLGRLFVFRDVTERQRDREHLLQSLGLLSALVEALPLGMLLADRDGRIVRVNQRLVDLIGLTGSVEGLVGQPAHLVHDHMMQLVPDGETTIGQICTASEAMYGVRQPLKDGRVLECDAIPFQVDSGLPYRLFVWRDVTERAQFEDRVHQVDKTEAMGRLAGGVAHDFNNLLTVINGYSQVALSQLNEKDPVREDLLEIRDAGNRAVDLTRQLLTLGRRQKLDMRVLSLNAVIEGVTKMLGRLIGEDVDVITDLDAGLSDILADAGQMERVLVNLATNARDAMLLGGTLRIATENVVAATPLSTHGLSAEPGPYVLLSVSDTGAGIPAEAMENLFEPFFTTKQPGKGTGLGLSIVYSIVSQMGGSIDVVSHPGEGTSFRIYLPKATVPTDEPREQTDKPQLPLGREHILLIEDQATVRRITTRMLEQLGYRVTAKQNGDEALSMLRSNGHDCDMVLCDVVMPGTSGRALLRAVRELRPELKFLFMSGYSNDEISQYGVLDSGIMLVGKPFSIAELAKSVRRVLDAS